MSKKSHSVDPYERLGDRAARGEYQLAVPMDYMLLSFLPVEGTLFAGLYPLGETVPNLMKKFTPEQQKVLTTKEVAARLRVLHIQKLCLPVYSGNAVRGKLVWQRTSKATELVDEWEKGTNHVSNS